MKLFEPSSDYDRELSVKTEAGHRGWLHLITAIEKARLHGSSAVSVRPHIAGRSRQEGVPPINFRDYQAAITANGRFFSIKVWPHNESHLMPFILDISQSGDQLYPGPAGFVLRYHSEDGMTPYLIDHFTTSRPDSSSKSPVSLSAAGINTLQVMGDVLRAVAFSTGEPITQRLVVGGLKNNRQVCQSLNEIGFREEEKGGVMYRTLLPLGHYYEYDPSSK